MFCHLLLDKFSVPLSSCLWLVMDLWHLDIFMHLKNKLKALIHLHKHPRISKANQPDPSLCLITWTISTAAALPFFASSLTDYVCVCACVFVRNIRKIKNGLQSVDDSVTILRFKELFKTFLDNLSATSLLRDWFLFCAQINTHRVWIRKKRWSEDNVQLIAVI